MTRQDGVLANVPRASPGTSPGLKRGVHRVDDWANIQTGIGVMGVDKRLGGHWGYTAIDQLSARDLWRGDDMLDRICTSLPTEMIREGWNVGIEGDKHSAESVDEAFRAIRADPGGAWAEDKIYTGLTWARAYGGCGMLLGADDGIKNTADLALPLQEDRIRSFDWMTPFSPMELVPVKWYCDPLQPRFGEPSQYRLTPLERPPGWAPDLAWLPVIHESRIVRFDGEVVSRGQLLYNIHPGWGDSVFVRIQQIVADFQAAWAGAGILLADFSVPTLKLKGLADLLASQDPSNTSLQARAEAIEQARSIARTIIIDSEEEYERKTTSIAGLPELLQQLTNRLASAARMPVSLLMGQAPAGLSATGDSDIRWFYDQVAALQERKLRWPLTRMHKLLMLAKNGPTGGEEPESWVLNFNPLWQLSETEEAAMRFQVAQADNLYIQNQVVTPEEVAQSRFGGDAYAIDTKIDTGLRMEVMRIGNHQAAQLGTRPEDVFGTPPAPTAPPALGMPKQPKPVMAGGKSLAQRAKAIESLTPLHGPPTPVALPAPGNGQTPVNPDGSKGQRPPVKGPAPLPPPPKGAKNPKKA
jgi:phage-related protein (TIGR01555 family)